MILPTALYILFVRIIFTVYSKVCTTQACLKILYLPILPNIDLKALTRIVHWITMDGSNPIFTYLKRNLLNCSKINFAVKLTQRGLISRDHWYNVSRLLGYIVFVELSSMARFYAGVCHGVFAIAEYDFIVLLLLPSWLYVSLLLMSLTPLHSKKNACGSR